MERGSMNPDDDIFSVSGPKHLSSVNWNISSDRTAVASCLVKGVYTMQRDKKENREGPEVRANPWWESFDFTLFDPWSDPRNGSIYAAVFEHKSYLDANYRHTPNMGTPPRYVIAIRGTMLDGTTGLDDVKLDINYVFNNLHNRKRTKDAIKRVQSFVDGHKNVAIWLAGHSLGAGLALVAGKTMARSGHHLESYIFNPPTADFLLKILKSKRLKFAARVVGNIARAGLVKAIGQDKDEEEEKFRRLATWVPYLYLNPLDRICSEYITYFRDRNKMSEKGADKIVKLATKFHVSSSEPLHLLPSADLMINTSDTPEFRTAHGIRQWWDPTFNVERQPIRFTA